MTSRPSGGVPGLVQSSVPLIAVAAASLLSLDALAVVALPPWIDILLIAAGMAVSLVAWRNWRKERLQRVFADSDRGALRRDLGRDALTGLMNRESFKKALDELQPAIGDVAEVLVLFFDLDRFKHVNDTLGHKVGDQLLIEVAERTRRVLGGCTAFARLSGDEFAAIVPCSEGKRPRDYGDALVQIVNEPFHIDGRAIEVAASVGLAVGDPMLDDGHELLRRADIAMYEAKRSQRGGCRIYDETLSSRQTQEAVIRAGISSALANGGFELHYQPVIEARTGEFASVEALLRCHTPELRNVAASDLIAVAEGTGQIIRLTDWTLDEGIRTIATLRDVSVAVNVSPIYFRHPDFVQRVSRKLVDARIDPRLLTVEVTEGVLISDVAAAKASISRLRDIGIKVYLDDFGTCYSSLNYLQHFELDGLKLDKSFLANIGDRKKATKIIRAMIDFAHSLDMSVVMEGVESDWQLRLLQLLGCDLLQGYALGAPMTLDEIRVVRDSWIQVDTAPAELTITADRSS